MTAPTSSRFLDLRALATLERLRFAPRQRIEGAWSGRHSSRRLGGAGEFADYREYTSSDDLRWLDWKVLARTGKAYLRLFQDETNLICTLLIDASSSMQFPFFVKPNAALQKLEYVQYLATAFSHVISRQQDQVGLAIVAEGLSQFLPPGSTPGHVARLQEMIENLQARPYTKLEVGLHTLFQQHSRRGVLIVHSDFLVDDLQAVFSALRLFRHKQWEVILLHIVHPDEERLPEGAAFRFYGLEGEGQIDCSPAEIRTLYQERFERHMALVRAQALAAGCDYRRVSTATHYLQTLGGFLVERAG